MLQQQAPRARPNLKAAWRQIQPPFQAAPLHIKTNTLPIRNAGSREKITAPRHSPVLNTNTHTSICRRQEQHLPHNNRMTKFFEVNAKVSNSCFQILEQTRQKRERAPLIPSPPLSRNTTSQRLPRSWRLEKRAERGFGVRSHRAGSG